MRQGSLAAIRVRAETRARSRIHPPEADLNSGKGRNSALLEIDLPETGTPAYWQADSARHPPRLILSAALESQNRKALIGTGLLLIGFVAAWILSYFPTLLPLFQKTWPEQLLVLGWLAWQVFGLPLAAIPLLAMGLVARLYLLGRWGIGLLHRAAAIVASPGSSTGSP
jgi:hypothetical protein